MTVSPGAFSNASRADRHTDRQTDGSKAGGRAGGSARWLSGRAREGKRDARDRTVEDRGRPDQSTNQPTRLAGSMCPRSTPFPTFPPLLPPPPPPPLLRMSRVLPVLPFPPLLGLVRCLTCRKPASPRRAGMCEFHEVINTLLSFVAPWNRTTLLKQICSGGGRFPHWEWIFIEARSDICRQKVSRSAGPPDRCCHKSREESSGCCFVRPLPSPFVSFHHHR